MSKLVLSFVLTMLCHGLHVDYKNMCPRSDKFCIKVKLTSNESYALVPNVTHPHTKVTFGRSQMNAIPGNFFSVFTKVQFLAMNRCKLQTLQEADFSGAENLKRLEMWKNQIQELPADLFSGAKTLEWLDLSSNWLRVLNAQCFHGLRKLKKLLLFKNQIDLLPPLLFRDLVSLEAIHLEDNFIEALTEDVFAANIRLGIVRIRNNRLKIVHPAIFLALRNLHWLDLSYNYFDEIQVNTLDTLHVTDCRITKCIVNGKIRKLFANNNEMHTLFLGNLTNTQEIHIANNRMQDVSSVTRAKHLIKLDVSQNRLATLNPLDFSQMPDLMLLNLSSTNLENIATNAFTAQRNLAILDLSHNTFTSISSVALTPLRKLRELYLDYNMLGEISYSNLRDTLPALKNLGLHGNNWKCSYLGDVVEYMDRNGISVSNSIYSGSSREGAKNVADINCTL